MSTCGYALYTRFDNDTEINEYYNICNVVLHFKDALREGKVLYKVTAGVPKYR